MAKFKVGDEITGIGVFHRIGGRIYQIRPYDYEIEWLKGTAHKIQGQNFGFIENNFVLDGPSIVDKILNKYGNESTCK